MGRASRERQRARASRPLEEQQSLSSPVAESGTLAADSRRDTGTTTSSRDSASAFVPFELRDATAAPLITQGKVEAKGESLTDATTAGAIAHFFQGTLKPAAFSLILLIGVGWFGFVMWILKNDSDAGWLKDWEGFKQFGYKVITATVLAIIATLFISFAYILFGIADYIRQRFFPDVSS